MKIQTNSLWQTGKPNQNQVDKITDLLNCSPLTAKLLVNRSICTIKQINKFLSCDLSKITPPWKIKDIEKASERIIKALENNEKIMIFGDYDADGITSTTILFQYLKPYSKNLDYFIPHRENDGYGFSKKHVNGFKNQNIDLIITVDCGSSDHEAIGEAFKNNIDVIVTDHHQIPLIPEKAAAVVNPHRKDCNSKLNHLAGVGVVFYLLIQLRKEMREKNFFKNSSEPNLTSFLDLVAIGTIADIVPLVNENRIFTKKGMEILRKNQRHGLSRLIQLSRINPESLNSQDIAFNISPRINSAGRIDNAQKCVEMLITSNKNLSDSIAEELNSLNLKRRSMEDEIVAEINEKIEKNNPINKIIIFHSKKWSPGILGTAASKIVKKYNKPCILLSDDGSFMKGSARSVDDFSIYDLIKKSEDLLVKFGGHSQAAGLTMKSENFENFEKKLNQSIEKNLGTYDFQKIFRAEDVVKFDELTPSFLKELDMLEPFGNTNPYPVFISKDIVVEKEIDIKKIHSKVFLFQPGGTSINRLEGFVFNKESEVPGYFKQVLIRPVMDRYNKEVTNLFIEGWE